MEEFEGKKEIIDLFNKVLGSKISIKDNIDKSEEALFTYFVNELTDAQTSEHKLFEESGIEINKYTDPLWNVLECILKLLYGDESTNMIMWYINDRFNSDGTIVPIEDEKGKKYIFTNPSDLWNYINYRYSKK
jgi:hypothetical protein